jgi:RNA polymerase sigma-70 factor (ECF subfamily)
MAIAGGRENLQSVERLHCRDHREGRNQWTRGTIINLYARWSAMKTPATRSPSMSHATADTDARQQFETTCNPFRADLLRFLFWLCRDRALAEDVMQETLLRAWRSFHTLKDRTAARPWLLTIARRELARIFERKRLETIDIDGVTDADQRTLAATDLSDVEEMRRAIMQLAPAYREPLVLQVLFGYSTEEIARHMELSRPAVLSRLFRARQHLRRQLLGSEGDEECAS